MKTIFLVDDDEMIQQMATFLLTQSGEFSVIPIKQGNLVLKLAKHNPPNAFLLDYVLEDMNGMEILLQLKSEETLKHIPVIFLTAKDDETHQKEFIRQGAVGVIPKPFDPMTFVDTVKQLLH